MVVASLVEGLMLLLSSMECEMTVVVSSFALVFNVIPCSKFSVNVCTRFSGTTIGAFWFRMDCSEIVGDEINGMDSPVGLFW